MASENDKLYNDWKGFLASDRANVRQSAVEAVLQVRDLRGMEKCVQHGFVSLLAKNASDPVVSVLSLKALVYLSSHGTTCNQCIVDLLEAGGLNRMLEIVFSASNNDKDWKKRVNFAMSLLANMTRTEEGAVQLVGLMEPTKEEKLPTKPTLELLLARFLNPKYIEWTDYDVLPDEELDSHEGDPYQHFAAVLMNSTQTESGRLFVLKIRRENDKESTVLQTILPQLRSPNPIRRRGVAGTIRNCCLERDSAWWFLNVVRLLKHILYPLAGPEELDIDEKQGLDPDLWLEGPDKKREPDHLTRLFLVESILVLCTTGRHNRKTLRLERTYVILKWADMVEEHEDVSERISDCVQYLRRDEEGTYEGSSDRVVEETYLKPASATVGANQDFDDVD